MAKKFDADFSENLSNNNENFVEQLNFELAQFGLKIIQTEKGIKIEPEKIFEIENLRIELAKLGLKIISELNERRISKPEETYNSLVALYNAVKN